MTQIEIVEIDHENDRIAYWAILAGQKFGESQTRPYQQSISQILELAKLINESEGKEHDTTNHTT